MRPAATERKRKRRNWLCHTPQGVQKGGESGPVIAPGKPDESTLFEKIHAGEMPPDQENPLTDDEVETIRRWIESGASFGDLAAEEAEVGYHDVLPLLLLRCTSCHGRQRKEGDLDLRTRASILKGGKSGPAIVPGKSAESLLVKRVRAEEMPPRPRLVEAMVKPMELAELAKLVRWINLGAPDAVAEPDLAGTAEDPLVSARGSGLLGLSATAGCRRFHGETRGSGSQSDRRLYSGEARRAGGYRLRPRRIGAR